MVVGEILDVMLDGNKELLVRVHYTIDGRELDKDLPILGGKKYKDNRYSIASWREKDSNEIKKRILDDIEAEAKRLTIDAFWATQSTVLKDSLGLVGTVIQVDSTEMTVRDTPKQSKEEWLVKSDGTHDLKPDDEKPGIPSDSEG